MAIGAPLRVQPPPSLPGWARREVIAYVSELAITSENGIPVRVDRLRGQLAEGLFNGGETVVGAFFLSALCDLVIQGWRTDLDGEIVELHPPSSKELNATDEKQRVRKGHLVERDRQLAAPSMRAFVTRMEETRLYKGQWVSVFSLMRDGANLVDDLRLAQAQPTGVDDPLRQAVDPYLQFVERDTTCPFTGLRLLDVWRYFRATWSSAHNAVPGRRMHILVRDRASPNHPVVGIAALSSAVVQSTVRDDWIGWSSKTVVNSLKAKVTQSDANYFDALLRQALDDIYVRDFFEDGLLSSSDIRRPSLETVLRLESEARKARLAHETYPDSTNYKATSENPQSVDWELQARSYLFRSKRAFTLAQLLRSRRTLIDLGMNGPNKAGLKSALGNAEGRRALSLLVRSAKSRRVGINMLEITTCGAVAPYAAMLGGKLVALLMFSPELVSAHRTKYGASPSLIASAMKGELVVRDPNLVLLGTTSLYGVASSQYNRLRVPRGAVGSKSDLEFKLLGRTEGFGSFHFSDATLELGERVAARERAGRRVNSIFGEGVNPKLRKLREALALAGFPPDQVLRHGSARLVYGVALAANFRDVLLGRSRKPKYLLETATPEEGTQLLAKFWRARWLRKRAERSDVLNSLCAHSIQRPVRHGARVSQPSTLPEMALFSLDD